MKLLALVAASLLSCNCQPTPTPTPPVPEPAPTHAPSAVSSAGAASVEPSNSGTGGVAFHDAAVRGTGGTGTGGSGTGGSGGVVNVDSADAGPFDACQHAWSELKALHCAVTVPSHGTWVNACRNAERNEISFHTACVINSNTCQTAARCLGEASP